MKINRESLLKTLTVASVGLEKRESVQQSNAYVFTSKALITYNGEIFTRAPTPLPGIQGAVPAEDLHRLLAKFPDDEVTVTVKDDEELRIKAGKRRGAGIRLITEVEHIHKDIPKPSAEDWHDVPDKLSGVLLQAARCCGRDETRPMLTVVRMAPDLVEGCDNQRIFRYGLETGFSDSVLLPASSIQQLGGMSFKRACYVDGYLHCRVGKHRVSVRCIEGDYPDLGRMLKLKHPQKVILPANLGDILGRAEVMHDSSLEASVSVNIKGDTLTLTSRKDSGWYRETKKIKYEGRDLGFSVHPKFLQEVFAKKKLVWVGERKMKIKIKEAVFCVCLEVEE